MEIHAFYGEFGLRNFEARNYMEKLDLDKLWIWRIYGDFFFNMEFQDHFRDSVSQGFQVHTYSVVVFLHYALM